MAKVKAVVMVTAGDGGLYDIPLEGEDAVMVITVAEKLQEARREQEIRDRTRFN